MYVIMQVYMLVYVSLFAPICVGCVYVCALIYVSMVSVAYTGMIATTCDGGTSSACNMEAAVCLASSGVSTFNSFASCVRRVSLLRAAELLRDTKKDTNALTSRSNCSTGNGRTKAQRTGYVAS